MWRDRGEGERSCAESRVSSRRLKEGFGVVSLDWGDILGILRGGRKKGIGGRRGRGGVEGKAEEEKGRGNEWLFLGGLFYNGFGICWESWDVIFLLCELIVLYVSMEIL